MTELKWNLTLKNILRNDLYWRENVLILLTNSKNKTTNQKYESHLILS